tara:strand:+ start:352 stop:1380 length:1029 start_codon:yes stop_codon:yes gene_type:complete
MTINPSEFHDILSEFGISFFTGVPDSTLKEFCIYIDSKIDSSSHIIASNEGNAIAIATGYHLSTGKLPLVYLQNSGLGNSINPLLSLADSEVYSIPMVLLIGWRGEPGIKDEPQHVKQGRIQASLLESLEIPFCTVSSNGFDKEKINGIVQRSIDDSIPCAIVVSNNTFTKINTDIKPSTEKYSLSREDAIKLILGVLDKNDILLSTTGKASREVFEIRENNLQSHRTDFLTVGSMGHCSSIALGVSLNTDKNVYCIDGDGSLIMHMGALATIGKEAPPNFKHIIINNYCHESVGGQSTASDNIDFCKIALANGYKSSIRVDTKVMFEKGSKSSDYPKVHPC